MKEVKYQKRFLKDLDLMKKRGLKIEKALAIIEKLQNDEVLPKSNKNHKLIGNMKGFWECHIEPDWLLIYHYEGDVIYLARTGTHSDLL